MMTGFLTSTKERRQRPILAVRISDILCQPDNQQDPKTLQALANRITQTGILQPFPVRKNADQRYELVSGSEQFQAAKLAGLQIVPCILSDNHSRNAEILALVEQIQQQNLSFFEEASAIERLISHYGMTQEDAAAKLGKAQSTIANKLRLLRLTETERDIILQYNLTERHARAEAAVEEKIGQHPSREPYRKRNTVFQNVRAFAHTIHQAVETMQAAGISADAQKLQSDTHIEYRIRIPVPQQNVHNEQPSRNRLPLS